MRGPGGLPALDEAGSPWEGLGARMSAGLAAVPRVRCDCHCLPGLCPSGGVWAVFLCPFTEEEPETLPRPWLLSFMLQGSVTVLFGVGRRGHWVSCQSWTVFLPTCWVETAK